MKGKQEQTKCVAISLEGERSGHAMATEAKYKYTSNLAGLSRVQTCIMTLAPDTAPSESYVRLLPKIASRVTVVPSG